jgi:hypothetical protein
MQKLTNSYIYTEWIEKKYYFIFGRCCGSCRINKKKKEISGIVAVIHYGRSYWGFVDIPHIFAHTAVKNTSTHLKEV